MIVGTHQEIAFAARPPTIWLIWRWLQWGKGQEWGVGSRKRHVLFLVIIRPPLRVIGPQSSFSRGSMQMEVRTCTRSPGGVATGGQGTSKSLPGFFSSIPDGLPNENSLIWFTLLRWQEHIGWALGRVFKWHRANICNIIKEPSELLSWHDERIYVVVYSSLFNNKFIHLKKIYPCSFSNINKHNFYKLSCLFTLIVLIYVPIPKALFLNVSYIVKLNGSILLLALLS